MTKIEFNLNEAILIANEVVSKKIKRKLTDVEILVLKGAWHREEYDAIAAKNQYATSYLSQDVAPKLWKILTESLGEKVKKSNFKEALKRQWEQKIIVENLVEFRDNSEPKDKRNTEISKQEEKSENQIDDFYLERPPIESICDETLKQPGSLIRIKAPNLMGKTSLMTRILAKATQQGYYTVNLSFQLADRHIHLTNLNKFLRWFCLNISRELGLSNQIDEYWDEEGIGSKVSCTTYFEEYLLSEIDNPLVLALDDVDILFTYPDIYEDFFGLLRSWHEKARSRHLWKKLRLAIAHATDVYIRLNINQSPFNVGLPIELPEFTLEQVQELAKFHGLEINKSQINKEGLIALISMIGGHPYLLEQTFAYLKNNPEVTLEIILQNAPTDSGIYSNHLREHWLNLQKHPELAVNFYKVVISASPIQIEPMSAYQLQSMGLIKLFGNQAEPRCSLYRQYFTDHLGNR